jgi:GT2 family glycosyltransferase
MSTSVIIVSYNTRDLLLRAIRGAREASQGVAELIVVDNASADGSAEAVRAAIPDARVIVNEANRGFAAAVNQGIRASRSPYVALLNSDAAPESAALRRMADYLDAHPEVGAVAPRLVFPDGSFQPSCGERFESLATDLLGGDLLWRTLGGRPLALPEPRDEAPRRIAWANGACLMLRRRALDEVGLLDEGFFMYEEDLDLCLRLGRAGWEIVYLPGVRTIHVGEASPTPEQRDVLRWKLRSRDYFARKHWGRGRALARRGATAVGLVLKIASLTLADLVAAPEATHRLRERRVRLARTLRVLSLEMHRGEIS